jgi:NADH-quinone oxidoreductase subunit H
VAFRPVLPRASVRGLAFLALVPLLAALSAGCERRDVPQLVTVTELLPPIADVGDVLVLTGQGFPTKKEARVSFRGTLYRGAESPDRSFSLDTTGTSQSETILEVPLTDGLRGRFGGNGDAAAHVTFTGDVEIAFPSITPGALPITGTLKDAHLDVRVPRTRKAAETQRLAEGDRVLSLLGIETEAETPPSGGLAVTKIAPGSAAEAAGIAPSDVLTAMDGLTLLDRGDVAPTGKQRFLTLSLRRGSDPHVVDRQLSLRGYKAPATPDLLGVALVLALAAGVVLFFLSPGPSFLAFADRARHGLKLAGSGPAPSLLVRLFSAVHAFLRADAASQSRAPLARFVPHVTFVVVSVFVSTLPFVKQLGTSRIDVLTLYGFLTLSLALLAFGAGEGKKWRFGSALGSLLRVAALQLPGLLAILSVVFVTGSLRVVDLVRSQAAAPWSWLVTRTPVFPFLVLAMLAAPLVRIGGDAGPLPEAELEPESERPGLAAACGALARWMSAHGAAALVAIVFLGGFHVPFVDRTAVETKVGYGALAATILLLKTWSVLFVLLAAKRTLPGLSSRQAMGPLFRLVLPACVVGLASSVGFLAWDPDSFTRRLLAFVTTGLVVAVAVYAGKRTTVRSAGRLHGHVSPYI